jgi:hypothetical protein
MIEDEDDSEFYKNPNGFEDDFDDYSEEDSELDYYDDDSNLSYDDVFKEEDDFDEPYDDHEPEDGYDYRRGSKNTSYDDYN